MLATLLMTLPLAPVGPLPQDLASPPAVRMLDVTGDELPDRLERSASGSFRIAVNLGARLFRDVEQTHWVAPIADVLVHDLDGDGRQDLYLVTSGANLALLGGGRGDFRQATADLGLNDQGGGVAAEMIDLDGDGHDDLLLHNATHDVVFWSAGGGRFERSDDTPPQAEAPVGPLDPVIDDEADDGEQPGAPAPTATPPSFLAPLLPGGTLGLDPRADAADTIVGRTAPAPTPLPSYSAVLDALYVNDDEGEVGPADIPNGTLTGGDVSTEGGDVYHVAAPGPSSTAYLGIGTQNPAADLHVKASAYAPGDVRLMLQPRDPLVGVEGEAELWLTRDDPDKAFVIAHGNDNRLSIHGTNDGGATLVGPVLSVSRGSGYVGIHTDAPDAAIGVKALSGSTTMVRGIDTSGSTVFRVQDDGKTSIGSGVPSGMFGIRGNGTTSTLFRAMDDAGDTKVRISDTGRIVCKTIEIQGGMDLIETFPADGELPAGSLVRVCDDGLRIDATRGAYDRGVVGIVSGAGDIRPGLHLSQPDVLPGEVPVALVGRVMVRTCDEGGPVRPGDLLVSASEPGTAMRADDAVRAFGAVVGKALSAPDADGLVLVLVGLQ